ncbi:hypothetical protein EJF18_10649 [Clavispora lusitaniae]|uniref:Uncharacterized protein n=2 Tax=Clavispora lusitaniae TaxID=36911 RepID=C4XXG4_CLAL4|nr:uncharacterized protein CLUG_00637 [Clavispora lusitaniae ATCC 42720]KAF5213012.1 hypothetical protein E0198_000526 [Clavispora lusitaniae]EEQ36514.1 hypothetical protein CLUG_00637 [Clavispora lusitaniae ATCC 42720]QFZ25550.1 hypothetical protein EJF14_10649 [Clavispora lusitaniae]QFZ31147.1 hypothetical protein EJF16_10649 [Clavispora lusitaniae]QFZ36815.1 hypothetical protein EJF15_10649 [Clavispora lusitaniae]
MDSPVDLDYEMEEQPASLPPPPPPEPRKRDRTKSDKEKAIDRNGLLVPATPSPQEQVLYRVESRPKHHPTRALFFGNLRRPVNAITFQAHLRRLAQERSASIERAWMNRTRSHAVVLVSSVEAATALRDQMNGSLYPPPEEREALADQLLSIETEQYEEAKRTGQAAAEPSRLDLSSIPQHELFVDFIQVSQINQWIFEEDHGPRNGKWLVAYRRKGEHGDVEADHLLVEGDFKPVHPSERRKRVRREPDDRDHNQRGRYSRGYNRARSRSASP